MGQVDNLRLPYGGMADPADEAVRKAKEQAENGDPSGAERTLEDYLRTDPHNTAPRLYLAQLWANHLGNRDVAMMHLEIVLDLEPENMEALKMLVLMLRVDRKRAREAMETYGRLISAFPEDPDLLNSYAVFLKNQMLDFEGSAEVYERALELAPDRSEIHYNYSILLVREMKDYVKARHHLETAVRLDPGNRNAQKGLDVLMRKRFRNDLPRRTLFKR